MYESLISSDPRLDSRIKEIGKFWHITISYIAPEDEADVIISWLNGEVVEEAVAKADKFTSAYERELSVMSAVANPAELVIATSGGNQFYKKEAYFLTDADAENAIKCMKAGMRIFTKNHCRDEDIKTQLLAKIDAIGEYDLEAAQLFMATYFDYGTAYTQGKQTFPEFAVNWVW
jgi:hypothetical protein